MAVIRIISVSAPRKHHENPPVTASATHLPAIYTASTPDHNNTTTRCSLTRKVVSTFHAQAPEKNKIVLPKNKRTMHFSFSPSPPSTSYSASPMDIPSLSRSRIEALSCAYPSWPRRSSLSSDSGSGYQGPVDSYISDDDLVFPSVFDDADYTPLPTPHSNCARSPAALVAITPEPQVVVDTAAVMRHLIAEERARRERKHRGSRSSRKSRSSSSGKPMSPITEVGE